MAGLVELHADGIQPGDVIKSIDGTSLDSARDYEKAMASLVAGKEYTLRIKRLDATTKKLQTITVVTRAVDLDEVHAAHARMVLRKQLDDHEKFVADKWAWRWKCTGCAKSGEVWKPKREDQNLVQPRCNDCNGVLIWNQLSGFTD